MDTKDGFVIEMAEGRVKEDVDPQEFLKASDNLLSDLRGLEGYIRREVWQGDDGRFVDILYWDSLENAQRAVEIFPTLPGAQPFEALLDPSSLSMRHFRQVRVYDTVGETDGKA